MEAVEFNISGRVQGVGFRYFTFQVAQELNITGWVSNMPDGTVRCHAAGDPHAMALFRRKLEEGPRFGQTDHIDAQPISDEEAASFVVFEILQ